MQLCGVLVCVWCRGAGYQMQADKCRTMKARMASRPKPDGADRSCMKPDHSTRVKTILSSRVHSA
eukprot:3477921-Rhodomonas_salina.1